jgi:hypothetical protein
MRAKFRAAAACLVAGAALAITASSVSAADYQEVTFEGVSRFQQTPFRTDTVDIFLGPKDSRADKLEYMIKMKTGGVLSYSLISPQSEGEELYQEMHGHDPTRVTFYKKATGNTHHGSVVAPFDGVHGWYLENRAANPVIVRISMSGFYELIEPGDAGNEIGAAPGVPAFVQ